MTKVWLIWWNKYMRNLSSPLTANFLPPHVAIASLVWLKWSSVVFSQCWCLSTNLFNILPNKIDSLISIHFDQSYYYLHYAAIYAFCAGGLLFIQIFKISNLKRYERSWQSKNFWYSKIIITPTLIDQVLLFNLSQIATLGSLRVKSY